MIKIQKFIVEGKLLSLYEENLTIVESSMTIAVNVRINMMDNFLPILSENAFKITCTKQLSCSVFWKILPIRILKFNN